MLKYHSALAGALTLGGRDGADKVRRLRLGEKRGWSLIQVAGFKTTIAEIEAILDRHLGVTPPKTIGIMVHSDQRTILRTGPEQFWIFGETTDILERNLIKEIAADKGIVTSLSHARVAIFIEGESARDILSKGIPIDFDPNHFGIGTFAMTGLHHTPILIARVDKNRYEIWALRTFALTLWGWLSDATWPLGYDVVD